jgi:RNA polymerase sigma-70 factor (ECF subfamily)
MQNTTTPPTLETLFAGERGRLVRLCTRFTGNVDVAEDLAQETLLEAWRHLHTFDQENATQPENWSRWLSAIAHNVCKRWVREHYHNAAHIALFAATVEGDDEPSLVDLLPGDETIEIELEREEMAHLLDRALALLPPSVREVLIERYINESSHAEISERLGLSEDALVQRLHRGKLALRRVISTQLGDEVTAFGITIANDDQAQLATRIWCPLCGKGQLIKYYDASDNRTGFTCPECWHVASLSSPNIWQGIKSPKVILARQLSWLGDHYWRPIHTQQATCIECGYSADYSIYQSYYAPVQYSQNDQPGICISCAHCGHVEANGLPHMTLDIPEARQFWRQHPRMRWLPGHEIDYAGRPALVSGFQSISDAARLDVIIDQATFKILSIRER